MNNLFTLFPGGKSKALTLSFDDGNIADRKLVDIFNQNGLAGTFHLNSAFMQRQDKISPAEARQLYTGHEISCHSCTHPTLTQLANEAIIREVMEDRRALEDIVEAPVRGFSYPNGRFDNRVIQVLRTCGFAYARTTVATAAFALPDEPLRWHPTAHHKHNIVERGQQFLALTASSAPALLYVWGHSYEFDRDDNWELIQEFATMMGKEQDVWHATNIAIIDYLEARSRIVSSVDGSKLSNPSTMPVWVSRGGKAVELPPGKTVCLADN